MSENIWKLIHKQSVTGHKDLIVKPFFNFISLFGPSHSLRLRPTSFMFLRRKGILISNLCALSVLFTVDEPRIKWNLLNRKKWDLCAVTMAGSVTLVAKPTPPTHIWLLGDHMSLHYVLSTSSSPSMTYLPYESTQRAMGVSSVNICWKEKDFHRHIIKRLGEQNFRLVGSERSANSQRIK